MTSDQQHTQQESTDSTNNKHKQRKLNPEQIPWFDESYTFSDRERELALLDDLLAARLADTRFQRQLIRQQIVTGDFGIPFKEDTTVAATPTRAACAACADQADKE